MSMTPLYRTLNSRTVTRALVLLVVAMIVAETWLRWSYEETLLPRALFEIKDEHAGTLDWNSMYPLFVLAVLYIASLVGLFLMTGWGRWLYTALSIGGMFYPLFDWSALTIEVDVLAIPSAVHSALDGALLAIIWLNAWSARGMASAAEGVDSPR